MNDFLTEKNKKTGVLGKLKWVLCGFCILFTLGAIGAAEKYIGEGRWGMAATEIILGLLFLYPTFREIQKALKKKKAREIACWFESYAQSTLSFEKFETEMGKDAVRKLEKMIAKGYIRNIQIDREENCILITAPNRRVNEKIYITVTCPSCGATISKDVLFCPNCGTKIERPQPEPEPQPTQKVCPECGAAVDEEDVFCTNCGARVDSEESSEKDDEQTESGPTDTQQ